MSTYEENKLAGNPRKPEGELGLEMLERMNETHEAVTNWAIDLLEIKESDRLLDIGCGGGGTLHKISSIIDTGHLSGIDYSLTSIDATMKKNWDDFVAGKLDVTQASVEKMPYADDAFDKIISIESFYFWPNPLENLKEVYRVLAPAGKTMITLDIHNTDELMEKYKENIEMFELFVPTIEEFKQLMEDAGFKEVKIHTKDGEDWIAAEGTK